MAKTTETTALIIEEIKTKKAVTMRTLSSIFWLSLFINKLYHNFKKTKIALH